MRKQAAESQKCTNLVEIKGGAGANMVKVFAFFKHPLSVRGLLIWSFLLPVSLLICLGGYYLYQAFDATHQAHRDNRVNDTIESLRKVDALLGKILFEGLNHLARNQAKNYNRSLEIPTDFRMQVFPKNKSAIPKELAQRAAGIVEHFAAHDTWLLPAAHSLQSRIVEVTLLYERLEAGKPVEANTWFRLVQDTAFAIGDISTALLVPEDQEQLASYLQLALSMNLDRLEKALWHEAYVLDEVIRRQSITERDTAALTAIRSISDTSHSRVTALATKLSSLKGVKPEKIASLNHALTTTLKSLSIFDDIRRQVYTSALVGGASVTNTQWQAALEDVMDQIDQAEQQATIPISLALQGNIYAKRIELVVVIGMAAALVISLSVLLLHQRRRILGPIKDITNRMSELADGDVNVVLPDYHHEDEISSMLDSIAVFKQNALLQHKQKEELVVATELAQASERLKSEFLASMSHEIRTPMNGVLGMLALLSKSTLDDKQHHYTEMAQNSAQSLLTVINDILDFSKIEAGKLDIESLPLNIITLYEQTINAMSILADKDALDLVLDIHQIDQPVFQSDPGRIRQILNNLVSNAIKFTSSGFVEITALVEQRDGRDYLVSTVRDTGIGISPEKQKGLFDAFTQVDASTTRQYGGTGLGLTIVKRLCQLMGGDVSVESRVGQGSVFSFHIALRAAEEPLAELESHVVSLAGERALVGFRCNTGRNALVKLMRSWGANTDKASDMHSILHCLDHHFEQPYKYVIVDCRLGDHGSTHWLKLLRARLDSIGALLILLVPISSALAEAEWKSAGADLVSRLPVNPTILAEGINELAKEQAAVAEDASAATDCAEADASALEQRQESLGEPAALVPVEATPGNLPRVLLVEDNLINQEVALFLLEEFGLRADLAENGEEALERLVDATEDVYQLIFMDCQMPKMDGYEATRHIRADAQLATYQDCPIIAMTANAMKGDKENCLAAGMSDYMTKPVDPSELSRKLKKWLQ